MLTIKLHIHVHARSALYTLTLLRPSRAYTAPVYIITRLSAASVRLERASVRPQCGLTAARTMAGTVFVLGLEPVNIT